MLRFSSLGVVEKTSELALRGKDSGLDLTLEVLEEEGEPIDLPRVIPYSLFSFPCCIYGVTPYRRRGSQTSIPNLPRSCPKYRLWLEAAAGFGRGERRSCRAQPSSDLPNAHPPILQTTSAASNPLLLCSLRMARSPSPAVNPSGTSPSPAGRARRPRSPPPSLSSFNTLIVFSLLLPLGKHCYTFFSSLYLVSHLLSLCLLSSCSDLAVLVLTRRTLERRESSSRSQTRRSHRRRMGRQEHRAACSSRQGWNQIHQSRIFSRSSTTGGGGRRARGGEGGGGESSRGSKTLICSQVESCCGC